MKDTFRADHLGTCNHCSEEYKKGDRIAVVRSGSYEVVICAKCAEEREQTS